MGGRFLASAILLGALSYALLLRAQTPPKASGAEKRQQATQQTAEQAPASAGENGHLHLDGWDRPAGPESATGRKPGPARVHDLSGIWEPVPGYRDGVFGQGPRENPADAKHMLPYTPLGLQSFTGLQPGKGTPSYLIVNGHTLPVVTPITNGPAIPSVRRDDDPFDICDPIGFPRVELFNLRAIQVLQTQSQVVIIYQNDKVWRNIWTDGRPRAPEGDLRAAVVRLFCGKVGGRYHLSGQDDWAR